ncbi:MAG: transporter [Bacteroidota bacterium]
MLRKNYPSILLPYYGRILLLSFLFLIPLEEHLVAQNIVGGFNAGKKKLNMAFSYTYEDFSEFYCGEEKMAVVVQDINIQSATLYVEYGITNRLDILANIPYISVRSSNENFSSMSDLQDLSLHLKYALVDPVGTNPLQLTAGLGVILPISDYDPLVPVTIGIHTRGIQFSAAGLYNLGNGMFVELTASQIFRNEDAPSSLEVTSKIGWAKNKYYAHVWYSKKQTFGGYDLGEPGFSLQTLQCNYDKLGVYGSYRLGSSVSVSLGGGYVLNGRNVGKSYCVSTGIVANLNL